MKHLRTLLLIALLVMTVPSMAQESDWSTYLFNGFTGELLRIDSDGTQTTYNLGVESPVTFGVHEMAFTADGKIAAYVLGEATTNGNTFTVIVRDLQGGVNLLEQTVEGAMAVRVSRDAFSTDASRIAVGILNTIGHDPAADTSKTAWQLQVYDIASGALVNELNADSDLMANTPLAKTGYMPDVRLFENNTLYFAGLMWFTHGMAENPAFVWDMDAGSVTEAPEWGIGFGDRLRTEDGFEWAYPALDESLDAAQPGGPMPISNLVNVKTADAETQTVYTNSEELPASVRYINDGQSLAIQLLEGFDETNPEYVQRVRWVALNRDGSVVELTEPIAASNIMVDAPGGYLYLTTIIGESPQEVTTTLYYGTVGGEMTEVWSMSGIYDIAWVSPSAPADDLPPFVIAR
jgi:hypothetical protein